MNRPEPGMPVYLSIDGQDRRIRFPLKLLKELDAEHGISILRGEGMAEAFRDPAKLAIVLAYGLRTDSPEITPEWIEEHVEASMLIDIAPTLAFAASGRWIDTDSQNPPPLNPHPLDSTGSLYGRSVDTTSASVKTNSGA